MKTAITSLMLAAMTLTGLAQQNGACVPYYLYFPCLFEDNDDQPMNFHRGDLTMNSGEERHGLIRLSRDGIFLLEDTAIQKLSLGDVSYLRLEDFDPLLRTGKTYTEFVRVEEFKNRLYRRLTYGVVEIYDHSFFVNERPGHVNTEDLIFHTESGYSELTDPWRINQRKRLAENLVSNDGPELNYRNFDSVKDMLVQINSIASDQ